MLRNFFNRVFSFCFAPSSKMVPIPHYLYDILNENPFKVLNIISYEFLLGLINGLLIFGICFFYLYDKAPIFFSCNWLVSSWLLLFCSLSNSVLIPRAIIFLQIQRLKKFINDFQMIEGNEAHDMLRNLLWNQILQTKIYFIVQWIFKKIEYTYFSGVFIMIIDTGEFGLFKACPNDHNGLKKICLGIFFLCFVKFQLLSKKLAEPIDGNFMKTKRIKKDEVLKTRKEEKVCSICLLEFEEGQEINIMKCKHFFHKRCIENWIKIKRKCPLCNKS